ncbi:MAG: hypothetical protein COA77_08500 [Thaumarchaeota archaeon]|nr:MAG: hypothetical protein COA77_08500 [Nitrososphaerota archaeon]
MQRGILLRTRTRITYFTSISSQSKSVQILKQSTIKGFDKFCNEQFHTKDSEGIIEELQQTSNAASD